MVRMLVIKHLVLKYHDLAEEVTVHCDESEYGLGVALLQQSQQGARPGGAGAEGAESSAPHFSSLDTIF